MKIFNTLSQKKETVAKKGKKKLFVCGPTVYDYTHIGHARTYLAFDMIVKYLRQKGWRIFYLQNITDIDDKIIARAKERNVSWKKIASDYSRFYLEDMKKLDIDSVDLYAPASQHIPEIISQVKKMVKKGVAYKIENDGYYFDITKFKDYGKLAHRTVEQAEDAVSRIDESVGKRNKGDFVLWKFWKPGDPYWNTELGRGRPGWHIEDTAISEKYFGPQYDFHGGARDLIFPHHEAEIAQQESVSGKKPFVKIWLHTGFLLVNGQKMAKSLGNFITIRDFLAKHGDPQFLRWFIFSHHYRSEIDYNEKGFYQARQSFSAILEFFNKMNFVAANQKKTKAKNNISQLIARTEKFIDRAMSDDFNTPKAKAEIFNLINKLQPKIWHLSAKEAKKTADFLKTTLATFGFKLETYLTPDKIQALAAKRELYRANKQFIQADQLREKITMLGYELEDTPLGPFIKPTQ